MTIGFVSSLSAAWHRQHRTSSSPSTGASATSSPAAARAMLSFFCSCRRRDWRRSSSLRSSSSSTGAVFLRRFFVGGGWASGMNDGDSSGMNSFSDRASESDDSELWPRRMTCFLRGRGFPPAAAAAAAAPDFRPLILEGTAPSAECLNRSSSVCTGLVSRAGPPPAPFRCECVCLTFGVGAGAPFPVRTSSSSKARWCSEACLFSARWLSKGGRSHCTTTKSHKCTFVRHEREAHE